MGLLGAKTKSKAKGKNKVRKVLGRSLNGWKWAIGYVWNGQWARDVARVAFSGAEQRARDKAFVAHRAAKPVKAIATTAKVKERSEPKSTNGATIHSAIQNASRNSATSTKVKAHDRQGSNGVKEHSRKLTAAEKRVEVARQMLEDLKNDR